MSDGMFPCKQRANTEEYRNNFESIFKTKDKQIELSLTAKESEHGTKRK